MDVDKLAILAYYLPSFARICASQARGWYYLDGFAGSGVNVVAGEAWYKGSALLGLSMSPPANAAVFIEKDGAAVDALRVRSTAYATRPDVRQGDCNLLVKQRLEAVFENRHLPAFCVLDPEGLELAWETVSTIAKHRYPQYAPYELMIYFSTPGVARTGGLAGAGDEIAQARLAALFGSRNGPWREVTLAYESGRLKPGEAGARYREIYKQQIEQLGYTDVIDRPVASERGQPIYHLILATNNKVGAGLLQTASEVAFLNNLPLPRG